MENSCQRSSHKGCNYYWLFYEVINNIIIVKATSDSRETEHIPNPQNPARLYLN
jgi:hypothetical protein